MYIARIGDTLILPFTGPSDNNRVSTLAVEKLKLSIMENGMIFSSSYGFSAVGRPIQLCSWVEHARLEGQVNVPMVVIPAKENTPLPVMEHGDNWVTETIQPGCEHWIVGMKKLISAAGRIAIEDSGGDVDGFIAKMDTLLHGRTGTVMWTIKYSAIEAFMKKAFPENGEKPNSPKKAFYDMVAEGGFKPYTYPDVNIIIHKE